MSRHTQATLINTQPASVSVVITTKNRLALLKRALRSVFLQDYPAAAIEVIVVNDGSSDGTQAYLDQLATRTPTLRCLHNARSQGACAARNQGLRAARGEFATGLDDDDEFMPDRLSQLIAAFEPHYAFVSANTCVIHPKGQKLMFKRERELRLSDMFWQNVVGTQVLTLRERFLALGGFDETLGSAQDLDLWVRLMQRYGKAKRLRAPLYRLHTEHDLPRVTTGHNKAHGMHQYRQKHQHLMTRAQQRYYQQKAHAWQQGRYWPLLRLTLSPSTAGFYSRRVLGFL